MVFSEQNISMGIQKSQIHDVGMVFGEQFIPRGI